MGLSSYELDRLADDMYKDRVIRGSVYCGDCGYNLRTLPYVHRCPECGNDYNARPLKLTGIFSPHDTFFPFGDTAAMLLCAVLAAWMIYKGVTPTELQWLIAGGVFAALTLAFAAQAKGRLGRLIKSRTLTRRIARAEEEEE